MKINKVTCIILLFWVNILAQNFLQANTNKISHLKNIGDSLKTVGQLHPDSIKDFKPYTIKINQDSIDQVNDSIANDSTKKKDALAAPVQYSASDSMVYNTNTGFANLYGEGQVNYESMNLKAHSIKMNMDSTLVYAQGLKDSIGNAKETPVFTQGSNEYRNEKMSYNFSTRKGFISNVNTKEGNGFLSSSKSKRNDDGTLYLSHAKYTTCDATPPHFYLALSRAKVKPGKEVIFGPAYLVVEDVPLPLAIPYGFFPFTKSYSSGFVMPSYGDETSRGFYLRDGGYYFAINDKMDLKVLGEIYTKGSWGLSTESSYRKRYKYSGNFYASFLTTIEGEKNFPDYSETKSLKVQWRHTQDAKASPNSSFSASVNYASTSYERNNLQSLYNPLAYTQSTRSSSVSYSKTFQDIGLSLSLSTNLSQNIQDSTIALTLPNMSISLARFYPFKKAKTKGDPKWYEKISMSYTGQLSNSISTKEDKLLHSSLIKDWKNAISHQIPISATFSLLNYINITPSFNFYDKMYSNKIMRSWDIDNQEELRDTTYSFYNVYNWNLALSANTTMYGFYKPLKGLFGNKIKMIRHVFKPSISFTYAPDFSTEKYGYYDSYVKTDKDGNVSTISYSPYSHNMYFSIPTSKSGVINMSVSNNLEMKMKSKKDSTGFKKVSLIDELYGSLSYNMVNKRWSDLSTRIRLKLSKNYTFSMAAVFATYAYQFNDEGNVVVGDRTEWSYGRFGRFQGMSQNISYTLNNSTFNKLFGKEKKVTTTTEDTRGANNDDIRDSNVDPELRKSQKAPSRNDKKAKVDKDGYLAFKMPWSLSLSYGISMREDRTQDINIKTMRYPYAFTQTMNFSGNIQIADGWNINYSSGYDFEGSKLTMTTASLTRDLHCFSMTCSMVLRPYSSFNFTFRANSAELADVLKWEKRSSYSSNIQWY